MINYQAIIKHADNWLIGQRHSKDCQFYPHGVDCTCGLGGFEFALCDLDETGNLKNLCKVLYSFVKLLFKKYP